MLQRRLMLTGGLAPVIVRAHSIMPIRVLASRIIPALLAPAIVSPSSLMRVSPIEQPLRWIARVRYKAGGSSTVIGESPFTRWQDFPTIVRDTINSRMPWTLLPESGLIEIHILRADESALDSDLFTGRQNTLDSKLGDVA